MKFFTMAYISTHRQCSLNLLIEHPDICYIKHRNSDTDEEYKMIVGVSVHKHCIDNARAKKFAPCSYHGVTFVAGNEKQV